MELIRCGLSIRFCQQSLSTMLSTIFHDTIPLTKNCQRFHNVDNSVDNSVDKISPDYLLIISFVNDVNYILGVTV